MAENNKSMNDLGARIREALWRIRNLAQEIVETAADPSRRLSDLFSEGAIQEKINACIELALAVADCNRTKWLREVRTEIEETQNVVIAADNALSPCMTLNPEMMNHFLGAEQKVFDMMLSPSPKLLALAKFARMMRSQLATYLHKECVSIRIELLHWESGRGELGNGDSGLGVGAQTAQARELVKYGGMRTLSSVELKILLDFFQESPGYVLDFSDASFNEFTEREIGVRVKDLYRNEGLSKHKALCKFCNTRGNEEKAYKLLSALMNYYDLTQRDNITFNERGEREYSKCKEILRSFRPIDSGSAQLSLDEMDGKLRALYKDGALFLVASSEDKITIGLKHLSAFIEAAILKREWRVFAHPLVVRVLTDIAKLGGETIRPTETKLAEAAWREFGNKVNALLLLVSKLPDYAQAATTARQKLGLCFQRGIVDNDGGDHFYRIISSSVLAELLDHFKWIAIQCHPRYKDTIELMYCGIFNSEWEAFDFLPVGEGDSDVLVPPGKVETRADAPATVGEFKPIKLEWKGPMVERYKKLEKRLTPQPDPWTADNDIDYVAYCALDYYRVLTEWVEYLRGETDEKPAPIKRPKVGESNAGDWMVGTIKPTILDPMKHLIENLPSLNTPDGKYPFKRIDEMFEALNQLAFILNHCEEELQSDVGSSMGLAAKRNYELHMLVCPEKTPFGKVILERKLIAEAFENFYKAFCGAAWALKDKVAKRESGKIDLTKLDKDIIMQQDKDHPEYELLQIEIDTLYCLPEASSWLFLRICRVMAKALERAKEDLDVDLPNYRWFAEGLSLIVRGLGHASGDENEITSDRVDVREALRNLVSALIYWQTMCMTNGTVNPANLQCIFDKLTLPYGDLDDEKPGAYDQFIEDMFFEERDGGLYYKPGPLASIFETCEDALVDKRFLPEDITSHVCANSIYFIEENDMGWFDEDRDEFMSNAIGGIYNNRHPKKEKPTAAYERQLSDQSKYLTDEVAEAVVAKIKECGLVSQGAPADYAKAVRKELAPEFQKISEDHNRQEGLLGDLKDKVGALGRKVAAGFTSVRDFNARWLGIFGKLFKYKKTPTEDVNNAMEDRYAVVNWERIKGEGCRQQIKDVIDYTYDEKPIIRKVSKKHLKEGTRIEGVNLKQACREAGIKHKEEWAKLKDKYADVDKLYDTCHSLFNSRRGKNPFKTI